MIRKCLSFFLVLFITLTVKGQASTSGSGTNLEKFEIGLDAMAPIRYDLGVSLLLKTRVTDQPSQTKKWVKSSSFRMLTTFYNDTRECKKIDIFFRGVDSIKYDLDTSKTVSSTVAVGYERQLYKKRVRVSFGGDLQFRYNKENRRSTDYFETGNMTYPGDMTTFQSKQYRTGISVFAGFNYYFTKYLSLGTEIHLPILVGLDRSDSRNLTKGYRSISTIFRGELYEPWPRLLYLGLHF